MWQGSFQITTTLAPLKLDVFRYTVRWYKRSLHDRATPIVSYESMLLGV